MYQGELDELYSDPIFDITLEYASVIKTMYMTAFYSVLLPIGMFWSILALTLLYWVDKWNLTHRCRVKYQFGKEYAQEIIEMLEYIIPIYGIASLVCIHMTRKDYFASMEVLTIIGIIIGFINLLLPM